MINVGTGQISPKAMGQRTNLKTLHCRFFAELVLSCVRFFAEFTLSPMRFFATLRMTEGEGLGVTEKEPRM